MFAHEDNVAVVQDAARDRLLIDERAVRALQILEHNVVALDDDPRVMGGDGGSSTTTALSGRRPIDSARATGKSSSIRPSNSRTSRAIAAIDVQGVRRMRTATRGH
jgi:hypothetical protein